MAATIHLPNSATDVVVKLHPVVLLSICDAFLRRDASKSRVIGTLLGSSSPDDNIVEVKNCYVVPHQDDMVGRIRATNVSSLLHYSKIYTTDNFAYERELLCIPRKMVA